MVSDALSKLADTLESDRAAGTELAILGSSAAMQKVFAAIRKFGATDAAVLITGESGTGKELVARAIHERSSYRAGPFVTVNCAALPATLIAGELFGHEKGASTGAARRRIGRLEWAASGTIFLDEIGDLPLEQQVPSAALPQGAHHRPGGRHPAGRGRRPRHLRHQRSISPRRCATAASARTSTTASTR